MQYNTVYSMYSVQYVQCIGFNAMVTCTKKHICANLLLQSTKMFGAWRLTP